MKNLYTLVLLLLGSGTLLAQPQASYCVSSATFTAPTAYERQIVVTNQSQLEAALRDAQSGDWIMLEPGDRNNSPYTGKFVIESKQNVIISGNPDKPRPVIDGRSNYSTGDLRTSWALRINGGRNIQVSYIECKNTYNAGLYAGQYYASQTYQQSYDITFTHNVLHEMGQAAIKMGGVSGGYIAHNTIYNTGRKSNRYGEGIYLGSGAAQNADTHDITVEKNEIYQTPSEAIDIKLGCYNTKVIGNYVHDVQVRSQGAITVWYDIEPKDPAEGVGIPTVPNVSVVGNRVHDVTTREYDGGGIVMNCPGRIESNVVWNVADHGIQANARFGNTEGTLFVTSNTVWNPGEGHDPIAINNGSSSPGQATVRYNVSNDDFRSDTYRDNSPAVIYEDNRTITADELVGPLNGTAVAFACDDVSRGAGTGFVPAEGASIVGAAPQAPSRDASLGIRTAPFSLGAWERATGTGIVTTTQWGYQSFESSQTNFTATFEAAPTGPAVNGLVTLSEGIPSAYADNAVLIRFNEDNLIDLRNGSAYDASANVPYEPNTTYRFRVVVNADSKTYTAYVQPEGGQEVLVGQDVAFRSEQSETASFNYWGYLHNNQSPLVLENLTIESSATAPTEVTVRARGTSGSEQIEIRYNNQRVGERITLSTTFQEYKRQVNNDGGNFRVAFINDSTGRNAIIDWLEVGTTRKQAELMPHNTGAWDNGECGGGTLTQWLHCNGYIGFGQMGSSAARITQPLSAKRLPEDTNPAAWLRTYPNPASETLTVTGPEAYRLTLYDRGGRIVRQEALSGRAALNVASQQPGIYLLRLYDTQTQRIYQQRVVIE